MWQVLVRPSRDSKSHCPKTRNCTETGLENTEDTATKASGTMRMTLPGETPSGKSPQVSVNYLWITVGTHWAVQMCYRQMALKSELSVACLA